MNDLLEFVGPRAAGIIIRGSIAVAALGWATGPALAAEPMAVDGFGDAPNATAAAWQAAEDLYDKQHFAAALAAFERLAAQGDGCAARRAGEMLFFADRLYPKAIPHDLARARRWLDQAAQADGPPHRRRVDRGGGYVRDAKTPDTLDERLGGPEPQGC